MKNPQFISMFVTNACNARCPHCFNWKEKPKNELTLDEIKKIDFKGVVGISVSGGEPTLRDDLPEICNHILKYVKNMAICTNGLDTDKIVRTLKLLNRKISVNLSLDGTKEIHEKIRGKNSFERTMKTLDTILKNKLAGLTVITTISKINKDNLEDFINFLYTRYSKKDFDQNFNMTRGLEHVFNVPKDMLYYHNPLEDVILSVEEMEEVNKLLKRINKKYGFFRKTSQLMFDYTIKILKQKKKLLKCYAGYHDAVLHSNGDVSLCEYTKPIGNLRNFNYDFNKLWNSEKANEARNRLKYCFCIHPCNLAPVIARIPKNLIQLLPQLMKSEWKNRFG